MLFLTAVLPALLVGFLLLTFYQFILEAEIESFETDARAIVQGADRAMDQMESLWKNGSIQHQQIKLWAEEGFNDRIMAAIPVSAAWNVGRSTAEVGKFAFRTPRVNPRNPINTPNDIEANALAC